MLAVKNKTTRYCLSPAIIASLSYYTTSENEFRSMSSKFPTLTTVKGKFSVFQCPVFSGGRAWEAVRQEENGNEDDDEDDYGDPTCAKVTAGRANKD
jgi:hypothetical protein